MGLTGAHLGMLLGLLTCTTSFHLSKLILTNKLEGDLLRGEANTSRGRSIDNALSHKVSQGKNVQGEEWAKHVFDGSLARTEGGRDAVLYIFGLDIGHVGAQVSCLQGCYLVVKDLSKGKENFLDNAYELVYTILKKKQLILIIE